MNPHAFLHHDVSCSPTFNSDALHHGNCIQMTDHSVTVYVGTVNHHGGAVGFGIDDKEELTNEMLSIAIITSANTPNNRKSD